MISLTGFQKSFPSEAGLHEVIFGNIHQPIHLNGLFDSFRVHLSKLIQMLKNTLQLSRKPFGFLVR